MATKGAFGTGPFGTGPFGPKSTGGGSTTTLTADQGSFTLTGEAATFRITQVTANGSFALTGEAAILTPKLTSSQGSFVLTGEAAAFSLDWAFSHGSFALAGQAAILTPSLASSYGSFRLVGEDAGEIIFGAITDTDILSLPINCVLMGRQLYRYKERASELWPRNLREAGLIPKAGISRIKGDKPSFTVRTGTRGYD